jgi:hypothetical protein
MSIYQQAIEEIHSFEAKYKNVIFRNNNIVIPYANLGVSNHPLHKGGKGMTFLDYAYMVFRDVTYLSVYITKERYVVIDLEKREEIFYFGGDYLDSHNFIFNDMEICCKKAYLQTLEITQLSHTMWVPFPTSNFSRNMNMDTTEDFFNQKFMPVDIKELIE